MALEQELATYKSKLAELAAHEGKYVLIHGAEVAGVFTAYEDAIKEGYEKFGLEAFLVKRIQTFEQVQLASRLISPTPTIV